MMQVIVAPRTSRSPRTAATGWSSAPRCCSARRASRGTSFGDVIEHSGAPRGSIYHHFPGGKAQLVEEAVRYAGEYIVATIERAAEDGDPVPCCARSRRPGGAVLEDSDFRAGCPVVAVAVEAHDDDSALDRAPSRRRSRAGSEALVALLRARRSPEARARRIATTMVAAIEGAVVICRATRERAAAATTSPRARDDCSTQALAEAA